MSSVTGTAQAGTSRSQYRGVRKRSCCRFAAEIRDPSKKRRVWLGTFDTSVEAALAYDRAATLLKGSRARTNFPPMDPTSAQYTPMKRVRRANLVPSWINSNMFVKSTVTRPWTHAYIKTGALDPLQMHPVFPQQNQTMPIIQPDGTGIGAGGGIRDGADSSVTDSGVSSSTSRHDERSLLDLNVPLPAVEEEEEEEEGGHDNSCKTLWLLN